MFVLQTLLTTTIFLNIFIAIISETFAKVAESKDLVTLREQVNLYHEYSWLLSNKSLFADKFKGMKYLYVLTPDE